MYIYIIFQRLRVIKKSQSTATLLCCSGVVIFLNGIIFFLWLQEDPGGAGAAAGHPGDQPQRQDALRGERVRMLCLIHLVVIPNKKKTVCREDNGAGVSAQLPAHPACAQHQY